MLDHVKQHLARRRAAKHLAQRTVAPWSPELAQRRVLVVFPTDETAAKEVWRFVQSLDVPPSHIIPVVMAEGVPYVPAAFISRLRRIEPNETGVLGLPKPDVARKVWDERPDVAFCLAGPDDLAAAYLVGASPAQFRIGFYSDDAEPFYDLMIAPRGPLSSTLEALRETLQRIDPPVLAFDTAPEAPRPGRKLAP